MTITEKIQISADKTIFTLFKEGIFYKCYNEDAMVFWQRVKSYKVSSKFIKKVGAEVLSLGFPISEVSKGKLSFDVLCEKLGACKYDDEIEKVSFYLTDDIKQGFENWCETLVKEKTVQYSNTNNLNGSLPVKHKLIAMIKNFDLANSTPMQGMMFIQQLKNEVQKTKDYYGKI